MPSFMTENIPPRTKVVLTYLKHLAAVVTGKVPPPVMTVGAAHGSLPPGVTDGGMGVLVGVFVLVGGMGVSVGTAVVTTGVLVGVKVFVGVTGVTVKVVGVQVGAGVKVGMFLVRLLLVSLLSATRFVTSAVAVVDPTKPVKVSVVD